MKIAQSSAKKKGAQQGKKKSSKSSPSKGDSKDGSPMTLEKAMRRKGPVTPFTLPLKTKYQEMMSPKAAVAPFSLPSPARNTPMAATGSARRIMEDRSNVRINVIDPTMDDIVDLTDSLADINLASAYKDNDDMNGEDAVELQVAEEEGVGEEETTEEDSKENIATTYGDDDDDDKNGEDAVGEEEMMEEDFGHVEWSTRPEAMFQWDRWDSFPYDETAENMNDASTEPPTDENQLVEYIHEQQADGTYDVLCKENKY